MENSDPTEFIASIQDQGQVTKELLNHGQQKNRTTDFIFEHVLTQQEQNEYFSQGRTSLSLKLRGRTKPSTLSTSQPPFRLSTQRLVLINLNAQQNIRFGIKNPGFRTSTKEVYQTSFMQPYPRSLSDSVDFFVTFKDTLNLNTVKRLLSGSEKIYFSEADVNETLNNQEKASRSVHFVKNGRAVATLEAKDTNATLSFAHLLQEELRSDFYHDLLQDQVVDPRMMRATEWKQILQKKRFSAGCGGKVKSFQSNIFGSLSDSTRLFEQSCEALFVTQFIPTVYAARINQ